MEYIEHQINFNIEHQINFTIIRKTSKLIHASQCSDKCPFFKFENWGLGLMPVCYLKGNDHAEVMKFVKDDQGNFYTNGIDLCQDIREFLNKEDMNIIDPSNEIKSLNTTINQLKKENDMLRNQVDIDLTKLEEIVRR